MLETRYDLRALLRAATLYYEHSLTQADIAKDMGVSRPLISKYLAEARRIGLVRIEIVDPFASDKAPLELKLAAVLGLAHVRIFMGEDTDLEMRGLAGELAAELRELALPPESVVLLSSGQTMYSVVLTDLFPKLPGVTLVPSVGGQREMEPWFQTNEIVGMMARRTGATAVPIHAPAMPSRSLMHTLLKEPDFQEVQALWGRADAALLAIGAPLRARDSVTSVIPVENPMFDHAVGDVSLNFFDHEGRILEFPGSDHLVRTDAETLRRIPKRIGIARGEIKATSILAAARNGLISSLITDARTARAVIDVAGDDA